MLLESFMGIYSVLCLVISARRTVAQPYGHLLCKQWVLNQCWKKRWLDWATQQILEPPDKFLYLYTLDKLRRNNFLNLLIIDFLPPNEWVHIDISNQVNELITTQQSLQHAWCGKFNPEKMLPCCSDDNFRQLRAAAEFAQREAPSTALVSSFF